ncbi:hypothetical protein [Streptomyces sp. NPDC088258]|uniref:hypothetical protein n=1 Tax=Streptomyces sp. NPDC088258 TaxID=3365849 RepID=UPI00380A391B
MAPRGVGKLACPRVCETAGPHGGALLARIAADSGAVAPSTPAAGQGSSRQPWGPGRSPAGPPRTHQGHGHTWEDVQHELCDVLPTSVVALLTLTPDAPKVFQERLGAVAERSPA